MSLTDWLLVFDGIGTWGILVWLVIDRYVEGKTE